MVSSGSSGAWSFNGSSGIKEYIRFKVFQVHQ
jgi:hypothetical protein